MDLAASVERTLLEQARHNALRLAQVRMVALGAAALLDAVFWLFPRQTIGLEHFSPANAALAATWLLVALAVDRVLRAGWNPRALRIVLALLDPVIVLSLFAVTLGSVSGTPKLMHPVTVMAAALTLIAVSGALSLSRSGAALTGALAVAAFGVVSAAAGFSPTEALFVCAVVACAGLLGVRLAENTRRAVSAEASRVILRRFLPSHLVDGDPRAALELVGRARVVEATVLITDLRGFTAAAERMAPEAALALLNDVQGMLAACVRRSGGTVDKFMGDGMLAVFGVPEPLPNHAAAALNAARDMRAGMAGKPLRIGIGIHSGAVVAGCVGSGERLEFTVIGDTVNVASRLEAAAKELGFDIVVSEDTCRLAGPTAQVLDAGEIALRGREQRLRAYTVAS